MSRGVPKSGQWEPLAWVQELKGVLPVDNFKTVIKTRSQFLLSWVQVILNNINDNILSFCWSRRLPRPSLPWCVTTYVPLHLLTPCWEIDFPNGTPLSRCDLTKYWACVCLRYMVTSGKKTRASRDGERESCIRIWSCLRISPPCSLTEAKKLPFAPSLIWVFVTCNRKNSSDINTILITIGTGNSKSIWLYTGCSDFHLTTGIEAVVSRFFQALVTPVITKQTNTLAGHRDTLLYTTELSRKLPGPHPRQLFTEVSKHIITGPQWRDPHYAGSSWMELWSDIQEITQLVELAFRVKKNPKKLKIPLHKPTVRKAESTAFQYEKTLKIKFLKGAEEAILGFWIYPRSNTTQ